MSMVLLPGAVAHPQIHRGSAERAPAPAPVDSSGANAPPDPRRPASPSRAHRADRPRHRDRRRDDRRAARAERRHRPQRRGADQPGRRRARHVPGRRRRADRVLAARVARAARAPPARGGATRRRSPSRRASSPKRPSFLVFGVEPDELRRPQPRVRRRTRGARPARGGDRATPRRVSSASTSAARCGCRSGAFRVVGIYHAGVPFEDQGAALPLRRRRAHPRAPRRRDDDRREDRARRTRVRRSATSSGRAFPGTVAISQPGQVARVDTNSLLVRKAAGLFVALALIIGGIAVMNTMLMAVFERSSEFALLLAVGWPRRLVAQLVLGEGLLLSLGGRARRRRAGHRRRRAARAARSTPRRSSRRSSSAWTLARAFLVAARDGDAREPLPGVVGHAAGPGAGAGVAGAAPPASRRRSAVAHLARRGRRAAAASSSWLTSSTVVPDAPRKRGEQVEHLRAGGRVQRSRRLVGQQQPRVADQRARDRDPLALTAGELRRAGACARSVEPDVGERRARALEALGAARTARDQRDLDVLLGA